MSKYDKSLTEVWKWKESVYQDVKDLTPKEFIDKIKRDADQVLKESAIELETIPAKEDRRKTG
ncbi:MAG: hypothetical protein Q8J63_07250 [Candidatus Aquicultor sp.]|nr:hypothetical protein [Candidatus Aquicultor sp.]